MAIPVYNVAMDAQTAITGCDDFQVPSGKLKGASFCMISKWLYGHLFFMDMRDKDIVRKR